MGKWQTPDQTQVHEATSQLQGNGILGSTSEAGTAPEEEASAVLQHCAVLGTSAGLGDSFSFSFQRALGRFWNKPGFPEEKTHRKRAGLP